MANPSWSFCNWGQFRPGGFEEREQPAGVCVHVFKHVEIPLDSWLRKFAFGSDSPGYGTAD